VPDVNGVGRVATGQQSAVGTEGQHRYLIGMAIEQDHRLAAGNVPDARRGVPAGRDELLAAWMPGQRGNAIGVTAERDESLPAFDLPHRDQAILASGSDFAPVRAERESTDREIVSRQLVDQQFFTGIPEPDFAVVVAGSQRTWRLAIGPPERRR